MSFGGTAFPIISASAVVPRDNTVLLVSVQCAATMLRQVVVLGFTADGRWRGDITVRKDDVRGTVRFRCRLVRRTEIPDTTEAEAVPRV